MQKPIKTPFKTRIIRDEIRRNAKDLIFCGDTRPMRFTLALIHLLLGGVYTATALSIEAFSLFGILGVGLVFLITGVSQLIISVRLGEVIFRLIHDATITSLWCFYVVSSILNGSQDAIGIVSEFVLGLSTIWIFLRSGVNEQEGTKT